jgi:glycosyltransferase involved in cell wall biosynthesis
MNDKDHIAVAKPRLRICHVITRMIVGGAQENTLLTVQGLRERGHEVTLVTGPTTGPEGRLLEECPDPGLAVRVLPRLVRRIAPLKDVLVYRDLRRFFQEGRFDVVHTHASKAGIVGRAAAWSEGIPLVVHTVHGQAFHPYQPAWRNRFYIAAERFAARRCHRIFAVAQAMVDQCVAAGVAPADMYRVVYSGMDVSAFLHAEREPGLREQLGIPQDAPVVGKIARLFELKGHDCLLKAAGKVVSRIPNVRFLLVGDGVLRQKLEQTVSSLGLAGNFVFAGLVAPQQIPRYVAQMDVLAHLSYREGLPRTVVQAMAGARPVVAFNLDGTPEVVENERNGILCGPGDEAAVAEALVRLISDPVMANAWGRAGRERVIRQFDWRTMVERIEAEYLGQIPRRTLARSGRR